MSIKASKKDVIWNYIGVIMSMASNFLLLPFMMLFVSEDYLGLWYIYLSIGGIVTLFDFGFNPTFARNVAYCWSGAKTLNAEGGQFVSDDGPNFELLNKVIDTCKRIYLIIAIVALVILLSAGFLYIRFVSGSLFGTTVVVSWSVYSIAVFLNLYYGYYASFLRGVGAVSTYNKINVFSKIIQIVLSIVLMYIGLGIIAVSIAYLLFGFCLRFFSKRSFYKYKHLGDNLKKFKSSISRGEIKELFFTIWHNAWKDGAVSLANYLANQASTIIASMYLSLGETGVYSISIQLVTAIVTISGALYTAYQPSLQSAYINDNKKESERLMSTAMTANLEIFLFGMIALIIVGIPLLRIIKPETTFDIAVIVGLGIYNYLYKRQSCYASFISNTNHVPYMWAYLISSALGIASSLIFVAFFKFGVWGLIIGQLLPQIIYNCWKWPHEVYKDLGTNPFRMLKNGNYQIFCLLTKKRS